MAGTRRRRAAGAGAARPRRAAAAGRADELTGRRAADRHRVPQPDRVRALGRGHARSGSRTRSTARWCARRCRRSGRAAARLGSPTLVQSRPTAHRRRAAPRRPLAPGRGRARPARARAGRRGAANLAGDPDLGARLASSRWRATAGPRAALELARAHAMRKRFADAEAVLAAAEDRFTEQDRRARGARASRDAPVLDAPPSRGRAGVPRRARHSAGRTPRGARGWSPCGCTC